MDIKQYAKENNVPIIEDEGLNFILNLIVTNRIKSILEIGSAIGYSSIHFASSDSEITVDTVERNEKMYEKAVEYIHEAGLEDRISIHYIDAKDFSTDKKYDLIFIDAAKAQYRKFFEKFQENLNEGGVIVCDNLRFHGLIEKRHEVKSRDLRQLLRKISDFVEWLKNNDEYVTEFYEIGDGISVSRRG
jgi:predicted O-methyltransferase YrrM